MANASSSTGLKHERSIARISALVLVNAMIFQEILSQHESQVKPLQICLSEPDVQNAFIEHWQFIVNEINYYPIFHVARDILSTLPSDAGIERALGRLAATAKTTVKQRAALRHDLMGRVYHRLLQAAKYLGTYYTSIPAAAILLHLAVEGLRDDLDWSNPESVNSLRVADLACGTGTLLTAAADAVTDRYVSESAAKGERVDLSRLHKSLLEEVLWGYDVLASATHLTASTLALRSPEVTFRKMNLFSLPLGGTEARLGSLEFALLREISTQADLFGGAHIQQVSGKRRTMKEVKAILPPDGLDLCVINPPFTRSVGDNLLFGSSPEPERKRMQKRLKKIVKDRSIDASITAGLGSVFVAIANKYVKPGGRLALVLPKALLSGVAWRKTRNLIEKEYDIKWIIASHDAERWNFSESTDLSEVLVVAEKKIPDADGEPPVIHSVNLWHNPQTAFEALAIAFGLRSETPPLLPNSQGALDLKVGSTKAGEAVGIRRVDLVANDSWQIACAFAQADLIRAGLYLRQGMIWSPTSGSQDSLPLCKLGTLGQIGPDRRDIYDGFKQSETVTPYPAFWGRDASIANLEYDPNSYLSPLHEAKPGRPLRKARDLWPRAGQVLLPERLRINTQSVTAIRTSSPVLSNVWWPFALDAEINSPNHQKALVLYLNSTYGLIGLLLEREDTEGAWIAFKKPALEATSVIDLRALSDNQVTQLAEVFDEVAGRKLSRFPDCARDTVRQEIDSSIASILTVGDPQVIREMLAQEPFISNTKLAPVHETEELPDVPQLSLFVPVQS